MYMNAINRIYEDKLELLGNKYIAGVDEVGRGPFAGPVVASCVILPEDYYLEGITDSKKLSKKKREYFYDIIKRDALAIKTIFIDNEVIDKINILEATKMAMTKAIKEISIKPNVVLIDAVKLNLDIETISIIKGDLKSITISAASIIAKVERDNYMSKMHELYPVYDFLHNAGYGTKKHIEALEKYGTCPLHRLSYKPVKKIWEEKNAK